MLQINYISTNRTRLECKASLDFVVKCIESSLLNNLYRLYKPLLEKIHFKVKIDLRNIYESEELYQ